MVDDSLARVERQIQGFDRAAASSTRLANPSGQREKYLQLPPHAEILPLVDSYFRHFRWYRMVLLGHYWYEAHSYLHVLRAARRPPHANRT